MKRVAVLNDAHVPFEDPKAYNLVLKILTRLKQLDMIILNGDYADLYALSLHANKVYSIDERKDFAVKEIECINRRLDELTRLFPNTEKVYISGNHENRFFNYINTQAPGLYGITSYESCIDIFNRPDFVWVPYTESQSFRILDSDIYVKHEPPGRTPAAAARSAMCNLIYAHDHTQGLGQVVALNGNQYIAQNCGWLGDVNRKQFKYLKRHAQWNLGFFLVTVDNSVGYVDNITINSDYTCCVGGKIFRG